MLVAHIIGAVHYVYVTFQDSSFLYERFTYYHRFRVRLKLSGAKEEACSISTRLMDYVQHDMVYLTRFVCVYVGVCICIYTHVHTVWLLHHLSLSKKNILDPAI